jgi:pilus assembly protein Flp/PilA
MIMRQFLKNFAANENGATAIEYALIAALVSVACIAAWNTLAGSLSNTFTGVATTLNTATSA